uniref:Uncharacterized protein n=1 Tax=Oryza barthii TaxID=65489 RepID=A0A0D3EQC7_9ORYZ
MAAGRWDGCVWTASTAAARWQPASYSAGGFCRWWVSSLLMGSDVRMWKWRDDGLCWREAGIGLDVRDGDFLIVGRVFSLSLVFPLSWTLFWSWGMLGGGRRLRLAVEVCGGWMAFRGWPRARLCRWLQSRCWRKPCRAFGRFDNDAPVGVISLLGGVVKTLFRFLDERQRRHASYPPWGVASEKFQCIDDC